MRFLIQYYLHRSACHVSTLATQTLIFTNITHIESINFTESTLYEQTETSGPGILSFIFSSELLKLMQYLFKKWNREQSRLMYNSAPTYGKRVDVVVLLDVEQHHRAPGAPAVHLIPQKLKCKEFKQ